MRSMVEGHARRLKRVRGSEQPHPPLHHLRWSPSPKGEDCSPP